MKIETPAGRATLLNVPVVHAVSTLRLEISNSQRAVPLRAVDSLLGRDTAPSSEAVLKTDMRRLRLLLRSSGVVSLSSPAMVRPKSEPPHLLEDNVRTKTRGQDVPRQGSPVHWSSRLHS